MRSIIVVGSCNVDLITYCTRFPKPGETLTADIEKGFAQGFGGKSANSAVAASRLGSNVIMVSKLGDDFFGHATLDNFKTNGIATEFVTTTSLSHSGMATILVEKGGENIIVIAPGANNLLGKEDLVGVPFGPDNVLVIQNEISMKTNYFALKAAKKVRMRTVLNAAPAAELIESMFPLIDILVANEGEIAEMTKNDIQEPGQDGIMSRISPILKRGVETVIVTLGKNGALVVNESGETHIPASRVPVVDTVGAGDCWLGAFVHAHFTLEKSLLDAAIAATKIAAISVGKEGTQTSFPFPDDPGVVEALK